MVTPAPMRTLTLNQFQTLDVVLRMNARRKTPRPIDVAEQLQGRPQSAVLEDLAVFQKSGYLKVADAGVVQYEL